jgi:hypothetical protein
LRVSQHRTITARLERKPPCTTEVEEKKKPSCSTRDKREEKKADRDGDSVGLSDFSARESEEEDGKIWHEDAKRRER